MIQSSFLNLPLRFMHSATGTTLWIRWGLNYQVVIRDILSPPALKTADGSRHSPYPLMYRLAIYKMGIQLFDKLNSWFLH